MPPRDCDAVRCLPATNACWKTVEDRAHLSNQSSERGDARPTSRTINPRAALHQCTYAHTGRPAVRLPAAQASAACFMSPVLILLGGWARSYRIRPVPGTTCRLAIIARKRSPGVKLPELHQSRVSTSCGWLTSL